MSHPDFTLLSPEDAAKLAIKLSVKDLRRSILLLSLQQIQATVAILIADRDVEWRVKIREFLFVLSDRSQLEALGSVLSPQQLAELLSVCVESKALHSKLEFLLVTLPQNVFEITLHLIDEKRLRVLKDLANTESIQHHLTLLIHELSSLSEGHIDDLEELQQQIKSYDLKSIRQLEIDNFIRQIEDAAYFFHEGLYTLNRALSLAWNSTRGDLIERLTQLKESWLRLLHYTIGRPSSDLNPATALYQILESRLCYLYESEKLKDSDPAMEGLTALGLWVLQDYWEVGLLPLQTKLTCQEKERPILEKLTLKVEQNLATINLHTVADLKRERIFSRNMLMRYIQKALPRKETRS